MILVECEYILYRYEMYNVEMDQIHHNTVTYFNKTAKVGRRVYHIVYIDAAWGYVFEIEIRVHITKPKMASTRTLVV